MRTLITILILFSLSTSFSQYGNTNYGLASLANNSSGDYNSAFGEAALFLNVSQNYQSAFGFQALYFSTDGHTNEAFGYQALYSNSSGYQNSAFGTKSLYSNTSGYENIGVGYYSLSSNTTGSGNTAVGWNSLRSNTIGANNTAFGYNARASAADGTNQTIIGYEATGQGDNSVVLGNDDVTAIYMAEDSGATVYAAGLNLDGVEVTELLASVTENGKTGFRLSTANAANYGNIGSFAVDLSKSTGYSTVNGATGAFSTAMGGHTKASGDYSTSMSWNTTASGEFSTVMGYNTKASDRSSLVIGEYNLSGSTVTYSATWPSMENTAFVIGNGTDSDNRSDALVVKFNGDATLAGNLNINSDARLKANIVSLGSTLSKLLQIDGKSYTMKKDESEKQKIGLLAQDIEKVFPELVSESNGVKSVNYQGFVPVLINALKEQEERIKRLEELLLD